MSAAPAASPAPRSAPDAVAADHAEHAGGGATRTPRELRRLLAAEGISNFGAMLSRLATPWLAALMLDATPLAMGALLVADVAAAATGALLIGAWVERRGKRAVMLACDAGRALVLAALALLAWQGAATMTTLALAAAANGVLTMAFEVARSAWMARRLAAGELIESNSRLSMVSSLSETAAFALGGWLFQWLGAVVALVVDALSYLASALCLRGVQEVRPVAARTAAGAPALPRRRVWQETGPQRWREVTAGVQVVAAHHTLRALAVIEMLLALAVSMAGTSYMIYVARDLAIPTGQLGLVFALGGLGAVAGARVAAGLSARVGPGWAMTAGLVALTLGAACVPLAAGSGAMAIALLVAHQVVGDGGHTLYSVHDATLRQTQAPADMLARADAAIRFAGQWATLTGAAVGGLVGSAFGARTTLVLCVLVAALAAAWAALRLRGLRAQPAPTASAAAG
ncbi:MAG: MFS transporter [Rubrivivax sp.]|nr:MFS transporter [Rubrivivax sp.]